MSMTRKEAIKILHKPENYFAIREIGEDKILIPTSSIKEATELAISVLRTPTREQVERMRREWKHTHSTDNFWTEVLKCSYCGFEDDHGCCFDFCPDCGTPMTDEAVDILWQRWKEAVSE